jgi:hypothetical protein
MNHPYNGIPAARLAGIRWQKSRRSNSQGACVELGGLGGEIAIRNSRYPGGPALLCARAEVRALIEGAKQGNFDHLLR